MVNRVVPRARPIREWWKLSYVDLGESVNTWMGDHQGRPGAVNLGPFVGVNFNL